MEDISVWQNVDAMQPLSNAATYHVTSSHGGSTVDLVSGEVERKLMSSTNMRQMLDSSLRVLSFPPFLAPCICNMRNANCSGHGSLEHGSVPAGVSIIGGGDVEGQKWHAFYETFSCVQQEASTKRGDRRSAWKARPPVHPRHD